MDTTIGETRSCHLNDCDLLERCVSRLRDEDWREFTRRYGSMIRIWVRRTLARRRVRLTAEEVEEHIQDFYVLLLASAGKSFRGRTDLELRRYLARVIWNLVNGRRRRVERRGEPAAPPAVLRWMTSQAPSPEWSAMARQHLAQFFEGCRQAASGVEVELKLRVMHLAFLDGCSSREIARRLAGEISPHQVDSMIFRLRRRLARGGFEVPHRRAVAAFAAALPDSGSGRPLSIDR